MRTLKQLAAILVAMTLLGCGSAVVQRPAQGVLMGSAPHEQLEFWHTLAESKLVSNDEAFHAVLLAIDGQDPAGDYVARVAALKDRDLLHRGFDEPGDRAVRRGTLAAVLVRALDIKGGVVMRIIGPCPRYALRELIHLSLFPRDSSEQQVLTGRDFVAILGRVDDYQRTIPVEPSYDPAGDEPLHLARRPRITPTPALASAVRQPVGPAMALAQVSQPIVVDTPRFAFFQDRDAPAAGQRADGALAIQITQVSGAVQSRAAEDQAWHPAQVGQQLGTGTELRTGVRSSVTFRVDPGRVITLDRLGVTRVLAAIEQGGATTVHLGAKYGRGRIVVEKGGLEHETTVATPGMTLAVRGTTVDWLNQGWIHVARGADGVVRYVNRLTGQNFDFAGPGDEATMKEGYDRPANVALDNSQQTPGTQKNTQEERLIDQEQQAVAGFFFRDLGIDVQQTHGGDFHREIPSEGERPPKQPPSAEFPESPQFETGF